ncbi:MAG TPA: hypothetical protein VKH65_03785 [Myxococcales bacterium]|nr:hypothetical protein [Myxococcales bacterium]
MDALRAAGGWLVLVSVVQLCGAAAVSLAIFLLRDGPECSP